MYSQNYIYSNTDMLTHTVYVFSIFLCSKEHQINLF